MRDARRALTIFEKMRIVKFAMAAIKQHGGLKSTPRLRVRGKVPSQEVDFSKKRKRGVSIQAICKQEFGSLLGGISVSRLLKRARVQKWDRLSEDQQRKMYSLTDEMKKALELNQSSIKGWHCLTEDDVKQSVQKTGKIQRWKVPGQVIQDTWVGSGKSRDIYIYIYRL